MTSLTIFTILHRLINMFSSKYFSQVCYAYYLFKQTLVFIVCWVLLWAHVAITFHTGHYSIVSTIILLAAPMGRNQNIREAVQRREERNRLVGGRESKRVEWRMGEKQGQSAQGHVGKRESFFALYLSLIPSPFFFFSVMRPVEIWH